MICNNFLRCICKSLYDALVTGKFKGQVTFYNALICALRMFELCPALIKQSIPLTSKNKSRLLYIVKHRSHSM